MVTGSNADRDSRITDTVAHRPEPEPDRGNHRVQVRQRTMNNGTHNKHDASDEWAMLDRIYRILTEEGYLGGSTSIERPPVVKFEHPAELKVSTTRYGDKCLTIEQLLVRRGANDRHRGRETGFSRRRRRRFRIP